MSASDRLYAHAGDLAMGEARDEAEFVGCPEDLDAFDQEAARRAFFYWSLIPPVEIDCRSLAS